MYAGMKIPPPTVWERSDQTHQPDRYDRKDRIYRRKLLPFLCARADGSDARREHGEK
ncbi:MAG: hypothetical protein P4L59_22080 [Desulfosporosinus sp.]|nr:hypothetical protein [Desulfosporosinus sp.]